MLGFVYDLIRETRLQLASTDAGAEEEREDHEDHEGWMKYMAKRFVAAFKSMKKRVASWLAARRQPLIQAAVLVAAGAAGAYAYVASAGFHAVGMVGVGFGVGAAAGSVALVLGAVIGLAIFGLISLRRAAA